MATLTADPPWTYSLGQASIALGADSNAVSAAVARTSSWGRFVGLGHGSGRYRTYTARQVVVMAALIDCSASGATRVGADLRAALVAAVEAAPWGTPEVVVTLGAFTLTYPPRWGAATAPEAL